MDVTRVREQRSGRRTNRRHDRRSFSRNADRTHTANSANFGSGRPMRGGIRL